MTDHDEVHEYHFDTSTPEKASISAIGIMADSLKRFRHTTRKPEELEWELRLYDFLLEDPVTRLAQYSETRRSGEARCLVPKRQVAEKLGWNIP